MNGKAGEAIGKGPVVVNAARHCLDIRRVAGSFAVTRLAADAAIPEWATLGKFFSVTRGEDELSVVCDAARVPEGGRSEAGWACLKIEGPFDFGQTGILESVTGPLAEAGVPIFAVSTFDTDYILVKEATLERACGALETAGHRMKR
jgi:hypothetical protein